MEPSRTVREEFTSAFGDQVTVRRWCWDQGRGWWRWLVFGFGLVPKGMHAELMPAI